MSVLATAAAFVAIAAVYLLTAVPTYETSAQLLLDPQLKGSEAQPTVVQDAFVQAQLEIANSNDVLASVVSKLQLASDPEFAEGDSSLFVRGREFLRSTIDSRIQPQADATQSDEEVRSNQLIAALRSRISFRQVGQSAVIEMSATSSDARKAVRIVNALADEYIAKNVAMKSAGARAYSAWLGRLVSEQQGELVNAATALSRFRASGDPRDQFKLTELQSVADARKILYQSTLTRYTEARQQISYPVSDATIVSKAGLPLARSRPRRGLILAFATMAGLVAGLMFGFARHVTDRRVMLTARLASDAGLPFVAPLTSARSVFRAKKTPVALFSRQRGRRRSRNAMLFHDVSELSASISAVRRTKRTPAIGFVGVEPKVGASTTAFGLAQHWAATGVRVLLVDAASLEPALSRLLAPDAKFGVVDLLEDAGLHAEAIRELSPTLAFLPLGGMKDVTPAARINSQRAKIGIKELKENFDAVFVDLSASSVSADARAIAANLDGMVVVARYRRTSTETIMQTVTRLRDAGADVLGGVVNFSPRV